MEINEQDITVSEEEKVILAQAKQINDRVSAQRAELAKIKIEEAVAEAKRKEEALRLEQERATAKALWDQYRANLMQKGSYWEASALTIETVIVSEEEEDAYGRHVRTRWFVENPQFDIEEMLEYTGEGQRIMVTYRLMPPLVEEPQA